MILYNKLEVANTLKVGVIPTSPTSNLSVLFEKDSVVHKGTVGNIIFKNSNEFLPYVSTSFPSSVFNFNTSVTPTDPNMVVSFKNQVKGTVLMAPVSNNGTPAFRPIEDSDLSSTSIFTNSHTHTNKSVLDGITSTKVSTWDTVTSKANTDGGNIVNIPQWQNKLQIGIPSSLTTTHKTDLVGAINEVNGKADNIEIGGRNYLLKSGDARDAGVILFSEYFKNDTNRGEYTLSFNLHLENVTAMTQNRIGIEVNLTFGDGSTQYFDAWHYVAIGSSFKGKVYNVRTLPDKVITTVGIRVFGTLITADVKVMSDFKIEKGNKATDWTPAPEDQVSDWNETDSNSYSFIKNKPTIPTSSDFITTNTNQTGLSGNKTTSGIWTLREIRKAGQNDTQMLLAGGGHRPVSDFALANNLGNYVSKSGDTMSGALTINSSTNVGKDVLLTLGRSNTGYGYTQFSQSYDNRYYSYGKTLDIDLHNNTYLSLAGANNTANGKIIAHKPIEYNGATSDNWNTAFSWGNHSGKYLLYNQGTTPGLMSSIINLKEPLKGSFEAYANSVSSDKPTSGGGYLSQRYFSSSGSEYLYQVFTSLEGGSTYFRVVKNNEGVWKEFYHTGNLTKLSQLTNDLGFVTTDTKYTSSLGITLVGNDFRPTYGTAVNTIAQGNDSRINNGQTAFSWGNHASAGYLKSADLNGYATESWVNGQGFSKQALTAGDNVSIVGSVISSTDTKYDVFTKTVSGLVPAPTGTTSTRYLREDGTWVVPTNSTYSVISLTELNTGTATIGRLSSAKVLNDWLNSKGYVTDSIINGLASESWVTSQLSSKANTNGSNVNGTWNNLTSGNSLKLGGQLPAYYLDYNNLTNKPAPIDVSGKANVDGGNITNVAQWKQKLAITLQDVVAVWNETLTPIIIDGEDNEGTTTNNLSYKLLLSNFNRGYGMKFSIFGSGTGVIQQGRNDGNVQYDISLNPFGGNVGIGTLNPQAKLHVNGNAIVANATEPNHAVTLEQLNNSASPYRYFQGNIFSDTPNFSNNTINGKGNQALGSYILHKGSRSTLIGDHIVSEGNYINTIGRRGSFSGGYLNSYGAYNTATGAHINLFGNYLTGSKSNYTAIGNYNKFDLINPEKEQNKVVVIGSGKSEYERENAIEVYTDNSSGFRGKVFYDEETRNPEWFGEQGTLVDTTVAGMHHLDDSASSYNLESDYANIAVAMREVELNGRPRFKSFTNLTDKQNRVFGIVDSRVEDGEVIFNPNKVHYKGTIKYSAEHSAHFLDYYSLTNPKVLAIQTNRDGIAMTPKVVALSLIRNAVAMEKGSCAIILGSFFTGLENGVTHVYFEFNQQVIWG